MMELEPKDDPVRAGIEALRATLAAHEDRLQRLERRPPVSPPPDPTGIRDIVRAIPGMVLILFMAIVVLGICAGLWLLARHAIAS